MEISCCLAMTAADIRAIEQLPPKIAYMGCHFSSCGSGLTGIPDRLPPGSVLILDDRVPICERDPRSIVGQLKQAVSDLACSGLLLDLQRPGSTAVGALCAQAAESLPCPVAVSHLYAEGLRCPVFLPPAPPDQPLAAHLAPWKGRRIWLDIAPSVCCITVTKNGSSLQELPYTAAPEDAFTDTALHCRYRAQVTPDAVRFCLWRTPAMLQVLLEEARALGVEQCIGLYRELSAI